MQHAYGQEEKLTVLVSIKPLALIAQELLDEKYFDVQVLVGSSQSAHNFALTLSDVKKIHSANAIVWYGSSLENFLAKPLAKKNNVVGLQNMTDEYSHVLNAHHNHTSENSLQGDPHIWLDPLEVQRNIDFLSAQLINIFPIHTLSIKHKTKVFSKSLSDMHNRLQLQWEKNSQHYNTNFHYAIYHNAISYYAQRFNLHNVGSITNASEQKRGLKSLNSLTRKAKQASCLLVDISEKKAAQKFALKLKLPLVTIDTLASNKKITTYNTFIQQFTHNITACFAY